MAITQFLQVKDNASTTLNGTITSGDLSIVVASGAVFPTTGNPFVITIDSEDILIDSRSTNTLTVNASGRGYNGTAAAAHTTGATVQLLVIAKSVQDLNTAVNTLEGASFPGLTTGAAGEVLMTTSGSTSKWLPLGMQGMINGKIVTSVASNNLTVAIKTLAGTDPSTTDPVYVRIGNSVRAITAALSVTKNAGTNYGDAGSGGTATLETDWFVYAIWNTTATPDAVSIGFSRKPNGAIYSNFSGTATNVSYLAFSGSDTPAASDECQNIGRFNAIISASASFNWSIPATSLIIQHPITETRVLTWTPAFGGFSSSPSTKYAAYKRIGDSIDIWFRVNGGGTSNATNFTITQFPYPLSTVASVSLQYPMMIAVDNGTAVSTSYADLTGTGITLYKDHLGSTWTGSGSKYVTSFVISYPVD